MFPNNIVHPSIEEDVDDKNPTDTIKQELREKLNALNIKNSNLFGDILSKLKIIIPVKKYPTLNDNPIIYQDLSLIIDKIDDTYIIHTSYGKEISSNEFYLTISRLIDLFGQETINALNKVK